MVTGQEVLAKLRFGPDWQRISVIGIFDKLDKEIAEQASLFPNVTTVERKLGPCFGDELVVRIKQQLET